jgi:tetratricopeptide (TPR) repeat protein
VAGFVKRYHNRDITKAPDIEFVFSDKERFKDVNKLLHRYAEKMSKAELAFLNIFSLFRKEVTESEFAGVFRRKMEDTDFNSPLVQVNELDFKDLVGGLVDWRLLSYDETKESYTAHPLIKTYFESVFDDKKKLCHKRIYDYFDEKAPEWPETLGEMAPLFEQAYHGCAADLHDQAFEYVYWDRIQRGDAGVMSHTLGAWATNLSVIRHFFEEGEVSRTPLVSKQDDKAWLLNEAGFALFSMGQAKHAEAAFSTSLKMSISAKDWTSASVTYQHLSILHFRVGQIENGLKSATRALEMAEKADSRADIVDSKCYVAHILHLAGKLTEAEELFTQAGGISVGGSTRRDFGLTAVFYADFLLSIERGEEALALTRHNLDTCQRNHWPAEISRSLRCLAAIERMSGGGNEATIHLGQALVLARKVGMPDLEVEALLEYGRLHLDEERFNDATKAADQAVKLCERTGFLLYGPDAEVVLGKAYLAQKDFERAKKSTNSARSKAKKMGYKLAENDAAELLKEIQSKMK